MTTEQDNQRVSDAYREIATQTTPADLDEKVLKLAAGAVRSRYGRARAWVRPLAWAATIALSLAFVLEMSQLNDVPDPVARDELLVQPAVEESRSRGDADLMKAKEEKDVQHGIAAKRAPAPAPAVEEIVVLDHVADTEEPAEEMQVTASRAAVSYLAAPEEGHCDAEARTTANDWFACIEALRDEGRTEDADSELEALREAFPDFVEDRE